MRGAVSSGQQSDGVLQAPPLHSARVVPFFFVAISRVGVAFTQKARVTATLTAIFLAYTVASSLSIYPHSLSYFNELAAVLPTPADASYPTPRNESGEHGGLWSAVKDALAAGPRNGPRHLLDSNIDWGQDLFYLEDWYESQCRHVRRERPLDQRRHRPRLEHGPRRLGRSSRSQQAARMGTPDGVVRRANHRRQRLVGPPMNATGEVLVTDSWSGNFLVDFGRPACGDVSRITIRDHW